MQAVRRKLVIMSDHDFTREELADLRQYGEQHTPGSQLSITANELLRLLAMAERALPPEPASPKRPTPDEIRMFSGTEKIQALKSFRCRNPSFDLIQAKIVLEMACAMAAGEAAEALRKAKR